MSLACPYVCVEYLDTDFFQHGAIDRAAWATEVIESEDLRRRPASRSQRASVLPTKPQIPEITMVMVPD